MFFRASRIRKTWLGKWLKSPFSEDPSTRKMANGPKRCSKLNAGTLTIFIDRCANSSGLKGLLEWYAES